MTPENLGGGNVANNRDQGEVYKVLLTAEGLTVAHLFGECALTSTNRVNALCSGDGLEPIAHYLWKDSPNLPSCHGQVLLVTNGSHSRNLVTKEQKSTKTLPCSPSPGPGLKGYKAFVHHEAFSPNSLKLHPFSSCSQNFWK